MIGDEDVVYVDDDLMEQLDNQQLVPEDEPDPDESF